MARTLLCAVGVDEYLDLPKLDFAQKDAQDIHSHMTDQKTGVVSMDDARLLVGKQATFDEVSDALQALAENAAEGDVLVFFFAGHAVASGSETYLLLFGERSERSKVEMLRRIELSRLQTLLSNSRAAASILIIDACEVYPGISGMRQQIDPSKSNEALPPRVAVIFADSQDGVVRESSTLQHGVLTNTVLNCFRHGASDEEGFVHFKGLVAPDGVQFMSSIAGNPALARQPGQDLRSLHELDIPIVGARNRELGVPTHPLDGSLRWIDLVIRAFKSAAALHTMSTMSERWDGLCQAFLDLFGLKHVAVLDSTSSAQHSIRVVCEATRDEPPGNELLSSVVQRMSSAFTEHDLWSRRRAGVREILDINGQTVTCILIPTTPKLTQFLALIRPAGVDGHVDTEAFSFVVRALVRDFPGLSEGSYEALLASALDELRSVTGFMPTELYEKRLTLFREQVADLVPAFQPIVSIRSKSDVPGFEALARDGNQRTPLGLFRVADLWGRRFKTTLDLHMAEMSIRTLTNQSWSSSSKPWPYQLSLNCFVDSLYGSEFEVGFDSLLRDFKVPAHRVVLEISERASLHRRRAGADEGDEETMESLVEFRRLLTDYTKRSHVRFAIDDFGIERANVVRLAGLKLSYVKIDRAVLRSRIAAETIRFVYDVMSLNTDAPYIIAEGWEEDCGISIDGLLAAGCTYIQGYGLGRPSLDVDEALAEAHSRSELLVATKGLTADLDV